MQIRFDGQKHIFWQFLLWLRPNTLAGMSICKISWLWPATVRSIFTAIEAKYKHLDTSIPGAPFTKLFMTELIHKT